jgi:hypothetical protein
MKDKESHHKLLLEVFDFVFSAVFTCILALYAFLEAQQHLIHKAYFLLRVFSVILCFGWTMSFLFLIKKIILDKKTIKESFQNLYDFKRLRFYERRTTRFHLCIMLLITLFLVLFFFIYKEYSDIVLVLAFTMLYISIVGFYNRWKYSSYIE